MSEIQRITPSGLECLRRIFGQFRRNINFDALITGELLERCQTDECDVIMELAAAHDLRPEKSADLQETAKTYNGPVLLKLNNQSWILLIRCQQIVREDNAAIFDPSCNKSLLVKKSQLLERASNSLIIFRNLQEVDSKEQSALFCLCAIARHHNISMDLRRVMHDFAIDTEEPRQALIQEIASSYELKTKIRKLKFAKIIALGQAFPAMVKKKNGKYQLCLYNATNTEQDAVLSLLKDNTKVHLHFREHEIKQHNI